MSFFPKLFLEFRILSKQFVENGTELFCSPFDFTFCNVTYSLSVLIIMNKTKMRSMTVVMVTLGVVPCLGLQNQGGRRAECRNHLPVCRHQSASSSAHTWIMDPVTWTWVQQLVCQDWPTITTKAGMWEKCGVNSQLLLKIAHTAFFDPGQVPIHKTDASREKLMLSVCKFWKGQRFKSKPFPPNRT